MSQACLSPALTCLTRRWINSKTLTFFFGSSATLLPNNLVGFRRVLRTEDGRSSFNDPMECIVQGPEELAPISIFLDVPAEVNLCVGLEAKVTPSRDAGRPLGIEWSVQVENPRGAVGVSTTVALEDVLPFVTQATSRNST